MDSPQLVFVTRRFWPLVGGAERILANLATELVSRGCRVRILTPRWQPEWPGELTYRGVPVVRLSPPPAPGWPTLRYLQALAHRLRREASSCDLVCVSMLRHEAYAVLRALRGRVPVLVRAESAGASGDCQWHETACWGTRIRRCCQHADAVLCSTPQVRRELEATGFPATRIREVALGVPLPPSRSPDAQWSARLALATVNLAFALPSTAPLVVYTGKLDLERSLPMLLAAFAELLARRPDVRFWIVGQHPFSRELRNAIELRGLVGRVVATGAFDDLEDVFAAADLFFQPAVEGSAYLSLVDAMAAGMPIVAADVPATRHCLTPDCDALLAAPEDPSALAQAMDRLLADSTLADQLGKAARRTASARFSLSRMIQEHLHVFQEFLREPIAIPS